ncbi:Crp/Fnr family transcriptional regulator [Flavobacterium sp.]|uniref:Crp/Fnr family transcriptional regulator n=1 Tax=Flavobacterium sp. TaxID=239 RepID=UPI00260E1894|nr:Crp/Fnr family transcriptional regulator [Flavobacterium sp.]
MNVVLKSIAERISFNEEAGEAFLKMLHYRELKRKDHLMHEGKICDFVIFIVSGCIRYYYIKDGEERTGQFFFENGWFSDYQSFITATPTQLNVQALEDCKMYMFYKPDLLKLYDEWPVFERFGRLIAEQVVMGMMRKNESLTNLSYEERYLKLIKERPKVVERVPLKYIASYLNMKPESLSRIRSRLSGGRKS